MKAAIRLNYGSPDNISIEEIEKPLPKENEILIKVKATTVNRTDCANLRAKPFIMRLFLGLFSPKKTILGTDFAGDVVEVGKNVTSFAVNDSLFGFNDMGYQSQAEYLCIAEDGNLSFIPKNVNYASAVASLEGAHYAYSFIHKVDLKSGQKVLINGATGAIGSALLQFAKQFHVNITATCNTKNIEKVKELGANRVIDYSKEDFTKEREKYDFVFDAVGKSTFGKCKAILNEKGVYISSELGPFAQNIFYALFTPIFSKKKVVFPIPYNIKITSPYILIHLKMEKFKPLMDREFKLEDISKAYEYVLTGEKTGNVIVNMDN